MYHFNDVSLSVCMCIRTQYDIHDMILFFYGFHLYVLQTWLLHILFPCNEFNEENFEMNQFGKSQVFTDPKKNHIQYLSDFSLINWSRAHEGGCEDQKFCSKNRVTLSWPRIRITQGTKFKPQSKWINYHSLVIIERVVFKCVLKINKVYW